MSSYIKLSDDKESLYISDISTECSTTCLVCFEPLREEEIVKCGNAKCAFDMCKVCFNAIETIECPHCRLPMKNKVLIVPNVMIRDEEFNQLEDQLQQEPTTTSVTTIVGPTTAEQQKIGLNSCVRITECCIIQACVCAFGECFCPNCVIFMSPYCIIGNFIFCLNTCIETVKQRLME